MAAHNLANRKSQLLSCVVIIHPDWLIRSDFRLRRSDTFAYIHTYIHTLLNLPKGAFQEQRTSPKLVDISTSKNDQKTSYIEFDHSRYFIEIINKKDKNKSNEKFIHDTFDNNVAIIKIL